MYAKDIEPKCITCQKGSLIPRTTDVVCELYGVVPYDYSCKKYKYDIFKKKIPPRRSANTKFSPSDFSID